MPSSSATWLRRRPWRTKLLGALTLVVILIGVYRYRPMSLLERSRRIVDLHDSRAPWRSDASLTTVWVNDRRLALLRYPDIDKVEAEWLDVTTGRRTPANDLMHSLNPVNAIPNFSPDGQWMLLTAQSAEKKTMDRLFWSAVTLDGKRFYEWYPADADAFSKSSYYVQWLPDSRQVAEFLPLPPTGAPIGPLHVHIHDVTTGADTPLTFRVPVRIPPDSGDGYQALLLPGNRPLLIRIDTGPSPAGEWLSATLFTWDSANTNALPRFWTVKAPAGCVLRTVRLSPRGDRIAWIFMRQGPSAAQALLHRVFRSFKARDETHLVFAISSIDGTKMRTIGELPLTDRDFKDSDILPWYSLEWMPGGTHLSYVYRNHLYTVPAD